MKKIIKDPKPSDFVSLPYKLKPEVVIIEEMHRKAYVKDMYYTLCFNWDGMSDSYNSVDISLDVEW